MPHFFGVGSTYDRFWKGALNDENVCAAMLTELHFLGGSHAPLTAIMLSFYHNAAPMALNTCHPHIMPDFLG